MNRHRGPRTILGAAFLSCMAFAAQEEASEPALLPAPSPLNKEAQRLNAISVDTIHDDIAGKSPAFLPKKSFDFFVTGDLLYRKVKLDNLDFATQIVYNYPDNPPQDTSVITMKQAIYEPHFRWGWGFRVDAGFLFSAQDAWETDLIWTYLYDKAHQSIVNPALHPRPSPVVANVPATVLSPSWPNGLGNYLSSAKSDWHLHFNTFDFEFARNYFLSKSISVRPLIGLRGAWIKQSYLVHYSVTENPVSGSVITDTSEMGSKSTYWGVGPRLGTDIFWHVTRHWGFYGNISGSLPYGQFRVSQITTTILKAGSNQDLEQVKTSHNPWRLCANIESGVGTQWETFLDKKRDYHLTLGLGYEIAYWFGFNQLERTTIDTIFGNIDNQEENGDLGMQGWNFHIRFDF